MLILQVPRSCWSLSQSGSNGVGRVDLRLDEPRVPCSLGMHTSDRNEITITIAPKLTMMMLILCDAPMAIEGLLVE